MRIEDYIVKRRSDRREKVRSVFLASVCNLIETNYNAGMEELTLKQLMLLILVSVWKAKPLRKYGKSWALQDKTSRLCQSPEKKSYVSIRQDEKTAGPGHVTDKQRTL